MEAYSVAVRVSLINGAAGGLLALARQFKSTHVGAIALKKELKGIQLLMLGGGLMAGAGIGILAAFKPALEQAKQFQNEFTKFQLYGMGAKANAEAAQYARAMNVIGTSSTDAMRLITESQGVFRESGALSLQQQLVGAKIAAPILGKLAFIESSLSAERRVSAHAQDLAMLRFIESRGGANDPRKFASIADWGYRLSKSSGGIVDWSQLQQFAATAGAGGFNLTQDAIAKLEPVIADLKGGRTGSGLRVAFQRLLGTQRGLPKQAVSEYLALGLWDRSKVALNASGGIKNFIGRPGEVLLDRDTLATDPVGFFTRTFLPAIVKKYGAGILGDSVQARTERAVEESMVFGPGTASAVFSQIDKLLPAIQRSLGAQQKQMGIDQSAVIVGQTMSGKEANLHAQFNTLLEQTGKAALPLAIAGLSALLPVVQGISKLATLHPTAFTAFVQTVAGLAVFSTVSGMMMSFVGALKAGALAFRVLGGAALAARMFPVLLTALATGLEVGAAVISSPITLIVGAVAAIGVAAFQIWKHWDSTKSVFANIKSELGMFWSFLSGLAGKVWSLVPAPVRNWLGHTAGEIAPLVLGESHALSPGNASHGYKAGGVATINVHSTLKVDGKKLAENTTNHQAKMLGGAQRGGSGYDPTMSPAFPGMRNNQ